MIISVHLNSQFRSMMRLSAKLLAMAIRTWSQLCMAVSPPTLPRESLGLYSSTPWGPSSAIRTRGVGCRSTREATPSRRQNPSCASAEAWAGWSSSCWWWALKLPSNLFWLSLVHSPHPLPCTLSAANNMLSLVRLTRRWLDLHGSGRDNWELQF